MAAGCCGKGGAVKLSLLASLLVQGYLALLGVLLLPVYLHYLGAEALGLVGLFLMLQAWIQILDMGFTAALSRDMARMRAGSLAPGEAAARLQALQWLMGGLALLTLLLGWLLAEPVAAGWLQAGQLQPGTVAQCLGLIVSACALRWMAGLYRGVLVGLDQQRKVNLLLALVASGRFAAPVALLAFWGAGVSAFFTFQVVVSLLELLLFATLAGRQVPLLGAGPTLAPLRGMLGLVGSMALLNALWVVQTQLDKLILSGMLSLQAFGHFTLAAAAAGGVLVLVAPLNQVVQPRLSYLVARGDPQALQALYRLASQCAVVGFVTLGGGMAFFAEPILRLWTGSPELAQASAPVLFGYGLANALLGVMLLPFMLQFAHGRLRLHVLGNLLLLALSVPALLLAVSRWGATGAGLALCVLNALFLLGWSPLVHRQFMPAQRWRWLLCDTLPVLGCILALLAGLAWLMPPALGLLPALLWIVVAMGLAGLGGALAGSQSRGFILQQLQLRGRKR